MMTDRNKILTLAGLAILWAGLVVWTWLTVEEPARVPLTNVSGPITASTSARASTGETHVQLDLLKEFRTQRDMTFAAPRNIFAVPRAAAGGATAAVQGNDPNSDLAMRRQAVATELAQFHYLGFVRKEDLQRQPKVGTLAVITKNDDLHLVRVGEVLEDHVVVKTIGQDSVTLLDRDSRIEHTLLLSEEPPAQP